MPVFQSELIATVAAGMFGLDTFMAWALNQQHQSTEEDKVQRSVKKELILSEMSRVKHKMLANSPRYTRRPAPLIANAFNQLCHYAVCQ